jgi:dTDP-4-dehydrorhamnose 3,5-epimerase
MAGIAPEAPNLPDRTNSRGAAERGSGTVLTGMTEVLAVIPALVYLDNRSGHAILRPMTSPNSAASFQARPTKIRGLWVLTMKQVSDDRGTVREFYRASAFDAEGIPAVGPWLQVNITETQRGAIRGLHGEAMNKLVAIVDGEAFGAYVDVRPESPTKGEIVTAVLTKGTQVLVPNGVCNGYQSVSEGVTQYLYCFDAEWVPGMAGTSLNPLDPELKISWPVAVDPADRTMISQKDASASLLAEVLR